MALGFSVDSIKNFGSNVISLLATSGVGVTQRIFSDVLEFRNLANSAYAVVRGATPVASNDFTTKAYVDAGPATGVVRPLGITVGTTTASSTTIVELGRVLAKVSVNVLTPYSVGATIEVTCGGQTLFAAGAVNAQLAGTTSLDLVLPATANGPLTVTVAGAPVAGACAAYVEYSTPLQ